MDLQAEIENILLPVTGKWGAYARNITTGETIVLNSDTPMPTASAGKQFVLLRYAELCAAGKLDPTSRVELTDDDHVLGSGVARYLMPGLNLTLEDHAYLMIVVSDNVSSNVLLRIVGGPDSVNAMLQRLGLSGAHIDCPITFHRYGTLDFATSTPRALAESFAILQEAERHEYPLEASKRCMRILFRQQHTESLPRRLPNLHHAADFGFDLPLKVYNKTGGYPGVETDGALFAMHDRAWIASVMGAELEGDALDGACVVIAAVGRKLYDTWGTQ
jgi:beta-lactamase class A